MSSCVTIGKIHLLNESIDTPVVFGQWIKLFFIKKNVWRTFFACALTIFHKIKIIQHHSPYRNLECKQPPRTGHIYINQESFTSYMSNNTSLRGLQSRTPVFLTRSQFGGSRSWRSTTSFSHDKKMKEMGTIYSFMIQMTQSKSISNQSVGNNTYENW